ncbi:MAG TPA: lamin tail domain-containing protein, partial [Rubricoccaceae bacterium]
MRRSALLLFALAAAASPALAQAPAPGDVVVNEIMYDPPAPQPSTAEWVEVVNRSGTAVDLAGMRIVDSAGGTSGAVAGPLVVAPGGFAVFLASGAANAAAFEAAFPGVAYTQLTSFPTLNNTGDTVRITLGGVDLDAVPYLASWGGTDASLERRDPNGPSTDASNFGTTTDPARGTPGRANSLVPVPDTTPPALDGAEAVDALTVDVTFSEPVAAASAGQPGNYSVSGVGTPVSATPTGPTTVRLVLPSPLAGPATFTLTVSNISDLAGNTLTSAQTTFFFGQFAVPAPRDIVVNEVMFDPPSPQPSGNEWVELVNRTADRTFDLAALRFADAGGTPVAVTTASTSFGPGAFVVLVRDGTAFSAAYPGVPFVQVPGFPTL